MRDKVASDNHPIEIEAEGRQEREGRWQQGGMGRGMWNKEGCRIVKERVGEIGNREREIERE